jgi:putative transcriptional regulator
MQARGNEVPTITNQIRRLRFEHGEMTQQELAERVGVTRQTIIAIEGGKYTPSLDLAFRLGRAFNAGVEDVFRWNEDSEGPAEGLG